MRITEPGIYRAIDVSQEEWRAVVGFEGAYEVSNIGRVRSLDRVRTYKAPRNGKMVTITRVHRGKLLQPGTMKSGHKFIVLGRGNGFCVHTLVLNSFVGPAPAGCECCHFDDDPANNRLDNLRWDTRAANMQDFRRNYGYHVANGHPRA